MRKSTITFAILAMSFLSLTSCKDNKKEEHHTTVENNKSIETTHSENKETTQIIEAYLQLKNGLVADDKEAATKGANQLNTAFTEFDMKQLDGNTHEKYMKIYNSAKEHAAHISTSEIAHQREHFIDLTSDISDLIALLGTSKTLYQDFCPMANEFKGAYWFSEVKGIKNPYFGAKMMTCGAVKKQIN
ncbi:DUF3347 domain-containing protein [Wenyingzhuangia sp. 1_MG-2023]|nr:DUF3347 domain-containing protein [Wenyingzhuangia sp. 1_MG-2023]